MFNIPKAELSILKKITTPIKIQDFLDSVPLNHEKKGETYMSALRALRANKMHCLEAALVAALALWLRGEKPLLMDLKTVNGDDHVVALYTRGGYWGAISKTNHTSLRFRDPVYRTLRELALSYFHEYFNDSDGKKILRSYSAPFDLRKFKKDWVGAEEDLHDLAQAIDDSKHFQIAPQKNMRLLRPADAMERRAGMLREWKKGDRRT